MMTMIGTRTAVAVTPALDAGGGVDVGHGRVYGLGFGPPELDLLVAVTGVVSKCGHV